jgi:poly(3-hydroxybutyrate) depolymerase
MHLRRIIFVFVFVLLLTACQRPGEEVHQTEVLEIDGVERTYHIHFSPNFSETDSAPLVLALHGGGGQGLKFDQSTAGTLIPAASHI